MDKIVVNFLYWYEIESESEREREREREREGGWIKICSNSVSNGGLYLNRIYKAYASSRQATPGKTLPSSISRDAPPPVEM